MTDTYRRVLVGTDGSPTATAAVQVAAALSARLDVPLVVATAWRREGDTKPLAVQVSSGETHHDASSASWAEQTVSDAGAAAREAGATEVEPITPVGNPAETLMQYVEDHPGTLTVVGTVGLDSTAERLFGNVPHNLTHHLSGDLLLVQTNRPRQDRWERIALATDGSRTAQKAVAAGLGLARALGVEATLITIDDDPDHGERVLRDVAAKLGVDDVAAEVHDHASAARGLVQLSRAYDLLVVGNKGMSGPSRLLGSVSNKVTHSATTDILLVNTSR